MLQPQIHWKQQRKASRCPALISASKLIILFCLSHKNTSLFQILQKATICLSLTLCWFFFFNSNMISILISYNSLRGLFLSLALKKYTRKCYKCKQEHSLPAWNMRIQTVPVFITFSEGSTCLPTNAVPSDQMGGWCSPTWNTHTCRKFKIIQRSVF